MNILVKIRGSRGFPGEPPISAESSPLPLTFLTSLLHQSILWMSSLPPHFSPSSFFAPTNTDVLYGPVPFFLSPGSGVAVSVQRSGFTGFLDVSWAGQKVPWKMHQQWHVGSQSVGPPAPLHQAGCWEWGDRLRLGTHLCGICPSCVKQRPCGAHPFRWNLGILLSSCLSWEARHCPSPLQSAQERAQKSLTSLVGNSCCWAWLSGLNPPDVSPGLVKPESAVACRHSCLKSWPPALRLRPKVGSISQIPTQPSPYFFGFPRGLISCLGRC